MKALEILKDFVEINTDYLVRRPEMGKCWLEDHWICASDGHRAILIPRNLVEDFSDIFPISIQNKNSKQLWEIMNQSSFLQQPIEIDFANFPNLKKEPIYKKTEQPCSECEGDGETECSECGSLHACTKCEGTGKVVTENINEIIGEKFADNQEIKIQDSYFNAQDIQTIAKHFPEKLKIFAMGSSSVCLIETANGIKILLMPLCHSHSASACIELSITEITGCGKN